MDSCPIPQVAASYTELGEAEKAAILEMQQAILRLVASGHEHREIARQVCLMEEALLPNSVASIMLLNEAGDSLDVFVAPSIPEVGINQLNGLRPGPGAGSCGNAVYGGKAVFVENTYTDPRWSDIRHIAYNFNLCACWSMPIRSADNRVIGSFALSSFEHRLPSPFHRKLLEIGAFIIGIVLDQTGTRARLVLSEKVFDSSIEGIIITDRLNRIVSVNPAFTRITGYEPEEVVGKNPSILSSGKHDEDFYRKMWADIDSVGYWQGEIWNRNAFGVETPEWLSINVVRDVMGVVTHHVGTFFDISEKKAAEELVRLHAYYDPLTALPNRRLFNDRLAQEIKQAHRSGLTVALLYIDLDRFKEVNDVLGHSRGDALLLDASQRICACVREADTVARLGGDEFAVLMGEVTDISMIAWTAQEIIQRLSNPFETVDGTIYTSASIGIALYPNDGGNAETLIGCADQALHAAKESGRRRYCYFTSSMQETTETQMRIANDLRAAIKEGGQFKLFYQPIVSLKTGEVHKAEALIRWNHPDRGLINPMEFIPVAEETGLINEIGDWVFAEAIHQAECWRSRHHPAFQISVNRSPVQFRQSPDNPMTWINQLKKSSLSGEGIVVEITESLLMDDTGAVNSQLDMFHHEGIQVSLDDFGTGYSSLSYLHKFNIQFLKIDKSFVKNLTPASREMALCEAIIIMAHKLNMQVIAEGVERPLQRGLLEQAGCDYAQGYLYTRPIPPEEFECWLGQWTG